MPWFIASYLMNEGHYMHSFQYEELPCLLLFLVYFSFYLQCDMKYIHPSYVFTLFMRCHGEPLTVEGSTGKAQQSQQDPGGGGEQHTQAGHMGVVSAPNTKQTITYMKDPHF